MPHKTVHLWPNMPQYNQYQNTLSLEFSHGVKVTVTVNKGHTVLIVKLMLIGDCVNEAIRL